jgi:hypothetical protein
MSGIDTGHCHCTSFCQYCSRTSEVLFQCHEVHLCSIYGCTTSSLYMILSSMFSHMRFHFNVTRCSYVLSMGVGHPHCTWVCHPCSHMRFYFSVTRCIYVLSVAIETGVHRQFPDSHHFYSATLLSTNYSSYWVFIQWTSCFTCFQIHGKFACNKTHLHKAHLLSCWMRSRGPSSPKHELTLSIELSPCNLCGLANVALHIHNCFNTSCSNIKPNVLPHWIADWLPHNTYSRDGKIFHCLVSNLYYNLSNK